MDIKKEFEIHAFCDNLWSSLIEEKGVYTDDLDDIVLDKANEKFELPKEVIFNIFHKIDRIKIAISGEFTAEKIRKALKDYEDDMNKE